MLVGRLGVHMHVITVLIKRELLFKVEYVTLRGSQPLPEPFRLPESFDECHYCYYYYYHYYYDCY